MGSKPGVKWSEIVDEDDHPPVVYTRKGGTQNNKKKHLLPEFKYEIEDDAQPIARNTRRQSRSWVCRALSSRGRKSIAAQKEHGNKGRKTKNKSQSRFPNKRVEAPPSHFVEEKKSYFEEVDSFELDEDDSSSPVLGMNPTLVAPNNFLPMQNSVKGLDVLWEDSGAESFSRNSDSELSNCSDLLSLILQTPSALSQSSTSSDILISSDGFSFHKINSSRQMSSKDFSENHDTTVECPNREKVIPEPVNTQFTVQENRNKASPSNAGSISEAFDQMQIVDVHKSKNIEEYTQIEGRYEEEDDEAGVSTLEDPFSLLTSDEDEPYDLPAFDQLLKICGQTRPMRLFEALSEFCDASSIVKLGEGTFGEAFKGGGNVFKIVPFDGDFLVNGEVQKTCTELFTEVLLSKTLNCLRGAQDKTANKNSCMNFIETKAIRVCEGTYDAFLVNAWEDWDEKHTSENDHPMSFPEKQLYVTFILADGGQDLESFVLLDFDEARSLLMQVTSSLAVAEAACEFEHRDLHWGNILLSHNQSKTIEFILQGKPMEAQTFGLTVSIIDFTLSRINTGNQILYLDLSADPALFEGPKRDTQAETYRKMLNVTRGNWEGKYPKTNSLWLHYVADTLLAKKAFRCSPKDKRALQAFRKRLLMYDSAEAALSDAFFDGMWVEN